MLTHSDVRAPAGTRRNTPDGRRLQASPSDSARDFAAMAQEMHQTPTLDQTAERVVQLVVKVVNCDSAGLFLLHGGSRVESLAATDSQVEAADQEQLAQGTGPCLEAIYDARTFVIPDTSTEKRWAPWPAKAAALGLRSVLSLRLDNLDDVQGALNLYSRAPCAFDDDDIAVGTIFAGHASVALATARSEESLRAAIDARHLIGQAQGILMERFGLSADQAFAVLLRYSQDKNIKLRNVAETVVSSRRLPS